MAAVRVRRPTGFEWVENRPFEDKEGDGAMRASYSVQSSGRQVAVMDAWSPAEALIEYLRGRGFRDDEIVRLRADSVSWRGAVFTATAVARDALADPQG